MLKSQVTNTRSMVDRETNSSNQSVGISIRYDYTFFPGLFSTQLEPFDPHISGSHLVTCVSISCNAWDKFCIFSNTAVFELSFRFVDQRLAIWDCFNDIVLWSAFRTAGCLIPTQCISLLS